MYLLSVYWLRGDYRQLLLQPFVPCHINALKPRQNACHFADGIVILLYAITLILINNSLKFVPKGSDIKWLGAEYATSHYLKQWWSILWRKGHGVSNYPQHDCLFNGKPRRPTKKTSKI